MGCGLWACKVSIIAKASSSGVRLMCMGIGAMEEEVVEEVGPRNGRTCKGGGVDECDDNC